VILQRSILIENPLQYEICGDNGISHAFTALLAGLEFEARKHDRANKYRNKLSGVHTQVAIERRLSILEQSVQSTEEKLLREARSIQAEVRDLEQTASSTEQATSSQSSAASPASDLHQQVHSPLTCVDPSHIAHPPPHPLHPHHQAFHISESARTCRVFIASFARTLNARARAACS
jgi:hypothetical protein